MKAYLHWQKIEDRFKTGKAGKSLKIYAKKVFRLAFDMYFAYNKHSTI